MYSSMAKTILVLEDEESLAHAITKKLELSGFDVLAVRSVEEAWEKLKTHDVSGVWLDHYLLGGETGLDFVVRLKEGTEVQKNLPIFVVSNTAGSDKVRSYLELGAKKFFTKSDYKLEQIIDSIKQAVEA